MLTTAAIKITRMVRWKKNVRRIYKSMEKFQSDLKQKKINKKYRPAVFAYGIP